MLADVLMPRNRTKGAGQRDWSRREAYRSRSPEAAFGTQNGANLHAYVGADPVNSTDPSGLDGRGVSLIFTNTTKFTPETTYHWRYSYIPRTWGEEFVSLELTGISFAFNQFGMDKGMSGNGSRELGSGLLGGARQGGVFRVTPSVSRTNGRLMCAGQAYVLAGNPSTIGRPGGFLGPVQAGSAAVIPRQFTGERAAGPVMRSIGSDASGSTSGGQSFSGFTDTIGHAALGNAETAQNIIMSRHPGQFVIELISGHQEDNSRVVLNLPPQTPRCPDGTSPF